jgi:hypothetical protein
MIKTTTPYHLPGYKTLELVVESEPISSSDNYDLTSIPGSSNPVMTEERTHSRAREQRPSRVSVQNVDVDENDEEEEWHLDVEEDDIHDATYINMDKTDDAVDVEEIVREWQIYVPFINRGMNHWTMCSGSLDNFWYVLSSRTRGTNVLSGSISVDKLHQLGKPKVWYSPKRSPKMIKHHGDKGRTYDVIPLDWGINNYDVYNRNDLIEMVIFYAYNFF